MTRPAHARAREEPRICTAEGCDEPLDHLRSDALYHSAACRTAAYRLRALETAQNGRKASHSRHRRSVDLRISYRKAVDAVTTVLAGDNADETWTDFARMDAERILRPLLTERQRAALDRREVMT